MNTNDPIRWTLRLEGRTLDAVQLEIQDAAQGVNVEATIIPRNVEIQVESAIREGLRVSDILARDPANPTDTFKIVATVDLWSVTQGVALVRITPTTGVRRPYDFRVFRDFCARLEQRWAGRVTVSP